MHGNDLPVSDEKHEGQQPSIMISVISRFINSIVAPINFCRRCMMSNATEDMGHRTGTLLLSNLFRTRPKASGFSR